MRHKEPVSNVNTRLANSVPFSRRIYRRSFRDLKCCVLPALGYAHISSKSWVYLGWRVYPGFIRNPPLVLFWIRRVVFFPHLARVSFRHSPLGRKWRGTWSYFGSLAGCCGESDAAAGGGSENEFRHLFTCKTINRLHAHRTHRQRKHPRHRHTHAHDKTSKRTPPTST